MLVRRGTAGIHLCSSCHKEEGDGKNRRLLTCNGCKQRKYCSRECQLEDWAIHKPHCGSLASTPAPGVSVPQSQKRFEKLGMEMMMRIVNSDETPILASLLLPSAGDAGEWGLGVLIRWTADAPDGSKLVVKNLGITKFTDLGDAARDVALDMPPVAVREKLLRKTDESHVGVLVSFEFETTMPGADTPTMIAYRGTSVSMAVRLSRSCWNRRVQSPAGMDNSQLLAHFNCTREDLTEKYGKQLHLKLR